MLSNNNYCKLHREYRYIYKFFAKIRHYRYSILTSENPIRRYTYFPFISLCQMMDTLDLTLPIETHPLSTSKVYHRKYEETIARNSICRLGDKRTAQQNKSTADEDVYFVFCCAIKDVELFEQPYLWSIGFLEPRIRLFSRFHQLFFSLPAVYVRHSRCTLYLSNHLFLLCWANKARKWNSRRANILLEKKKRVIHNHSSSIIFRLTFVSTADELISCIDRDLSRYSKLICTEYVLRILIERTLIL